MIRKLRTLIIAVVAVSALSAIASQSATAAGAYHCPELAAGATCYFTVESDTFTGHQVFTTNGGSVTCNKIHAVGEAAKESTEMTFEPIYSECTAFGFATAHVTTNGCHYTFTEPTEIVGQPTKRTIHPPHIVATPEGSCFKITPTAFGVSVCTQTVEPQTPTSGHLIATNVGENSTRHVTVETTVEGIHYRGNGGACGASGTTFTNGTYEGNSTVTCFSNAARTVRTACTVK